MLTLETKYYRAVIAPDLGGLLARFQFRHNGRWSDLLSTDPGDSGVVDGVPLYGCFPMVPFANRLSEPWLPAGGERRDFAVNWPREGLAIHGVGFAQAWQVGRQSSSDAHLWTDIFDARHHLLGRAEQSFTLTDAGLDVSLCFRNTSDLPLTAGVGLHPWFATPSNHAETAVTFEAKGRFEMSPRHLPVRYSLLPDTAVALDWTDAGLDTCFTGWNGSAVLSRPEANLTIFLRSSGHTLHCFLARDLDAICLEPVSHAPDAAHNALSAEIAPMVQLAPGSATSITLAISCQENAPMHQAREQQT